MLKEFWTLIKLLFVADPSKTEEVKVIHMHHFPFKGYKAMCWCGTIIHRIGSSDVDERTIRHETIHLLQAKQCGSWWKYYAKYLREWIKGNPITAPASSAYHTIPWEMAAYANEDNPAYLESFVDDSDTRYNLKHRKRIYKEYRFEWKNYVKSL